MSTDVAKYDPAPMAETSIMALEREPSLILEEAHRAARALKGVLDAKPNKVMFGGEQYLEFEDWATVGQFYAIKPVTRHTRPVEFGDIRGWEATVDAIHVPTGRVVGSADAMCCTDEEKWRGRPKYEWLCVTKTMGLVADPPKHELIWEKGTDGKSRPKKERVHVGEESVPAFQLRSMAQTRAGAKALRNALAWVVVLAGYRPTPAEELPQQDRQPVSAPPPPAEDAVFSQSEPGAQAGNAGDAPMDEVLERSILNEKIINLGTKLGYKGDVRAKLWVEHMGSNADPRSAPLEKLADYEAYLRKLAG